MARVRSKSGLPQQCPAHVLETYLEVLKGPLGLWFTVMERTLTAEALENITIIISFVAFFTFIIFSCY